MNFQQQKPTKPTQPFFFNSSTKYQSHKYCQDDSFETSKHHFSPNSSPSWQNHSPTFRCQQSPSSHFQRMTAEPVWEYLYNHGLKAQKQIEKVYIENQKKQDKECTFRPKLNQTTKIIVGSSSSFLKRNTAWMDSKIQKLIKEKEETINNDLKECTFTPKINNNIKKEPEMLLEKPQQKSSQIWQEKTQSIKQIHSKANILKEKKQNYIESKEIMPSRSKANIEYPMEDIKLQLRKQLKKISFE